LVDGSLERPCRVLVKCNFYLLRLRRYKANMSKLAAIRRGRSVRAKISGGRGCPWGIFFGFYKTSHILLSNSANCTVLRAFVLTQYRHVTDGRTGGQTDRRTDRQTDGIAIASTALAMRALRRTVID